MKDNPINKLVSKLNRIKEDLDVLARPDSKATFLKNLEEMIGTLKHLRSGLMNPSLEEKATEVHRSIDQVIGFLEFAKSDEILRTLLFLPQKSVTARPKRKPVEVASNLTNDQIRALLEKDLSKAELKAIAAQRSISIGKSTNEKIKLDILKNLERQESYGRLSK